MAFAMVTAGTLVGLVWTGWLAWDTADQIAARLSEEKLVGLRLGDTFAADLHELRSHFRRFEATKLETHWEKFEATRNRIETSLENQRLTATSQAEASHVGSLLANLEGYQETSRRAHDKIAGGANSSSLAPDIIALGDQASEMAANIRTLLRERQASLEQTMLSARVRLQGLVLLVAATLVVTVLLATTLSVIVWRGLFKPLQNRVTASEEAARRSEKLASLGILAAGVAHEIRNPLTAIKARLFSQQRRLPPDCAAMEDARMIDREINRLEDVVRSVLDFARPSKPAPVLVDPVTTLDNIRQLLAPEGNPCQVTVDVTNPPGLRIRTDKTQFHQVILNLVRNAMDAAGHDGHVRLRARKAVRGPAGHGAPVALIEIEDDGPGLSAEARERLFDPFFTTKSNGTGLGLSISARIVERNGGTLEFASNPRKGTTFTVSFPCEA